MDKIDKLKALLELSQNDTITPKEVEKFLSVVLQFVKTAKENFQNISSENLKTVAEALTLIEKKRGIVEKELTDLIQEKKKEVNSKIVSDIKDVKGQFSENITEAKKLLKEIKAIKVYKAKDGVDGIDGISPNPKDIVDEVLSLIPKQEEVELDEGEEIVEKINELPTDNDKLKIDASHIKNLPEQIKANGGGWRNLYQLHDVNITDPTDGQVLAYNSTTQLWQNSAGGGGSQTPWTSDIDADGYNLDNVGVIEGYVPYTGATASVDLGSFDLSVADEAYGAGWDGSLEVPTKNAVYDKIESLVSGIIRLIIITSGSITAGATARTDYVYLVSGTHTITMPTAINNSNRYTIKNNHVDPIIVNTSLGQNIELASSIDIQPEDSVDIISDGSNWWII